MSESVLQEEIETYDQNLQDWLSRYEDRFVLVKRKELIGVFNTMDEALADGARQFGLGSFLARQVKQEVEEASIPALTLGLL
jgi:hypothetical protein